MQEHQLGVGDPQATWTYPILGNTQFLPTKYVRWVSILQIRSK